MNRRGSFHAKSNAHQKTVSSLSGDATGGKYMTKKGRNGVIDVWWLDDTGGLTILLPNILRKKWHWKNCSIRLYVLSDGTNVDVQKSKMETLLHGVRIKIETVIIVNRPKVKEIDLQNAQMSMDQIMLNISEEELDELFVNVYQKDAIEDIDGDDEGNSPTDPSKSRDEKLAVVGNFQKEVERIAYKSAVGRLIKDECRDDTLLVVCTMSFPHIDVPATVHMTCMDVQSKPCKKPFLFVRGTQKRILTMDS